MSTYSPEGPTVGMPNTGSQLIVGVVTVGIFVAMFMEKPPDVVFMVALTIIMMTEILTLQEVLAGFANESLITIGSLFLVIGAVQKSHIMDYLARQAFGIRSSDVVGTGRMLVSMSALSAVFNNIPLCNLMIPIVRDWARSRGIPLSHLLIPLSYSVISGGLCTMIGTSTSLIVQGLMQEDIGYSFPFFAPGAVAVPATVLMIAYILFCAPLILPARSGLIREVRDRADMFIAEVQVMAGSAFIGTDVGTMVGRLGLQQDSVIKIRRRCGADEVDMEEVKLGSHKDRKRRSGMVEMSSVGESSVPRPRSDSLSVVMTKGRSIADPKYVEQSCGAWGTADDISVNGYRPVNVSTRRDIGVMGMALTTGSLPLEHELSNPQQDDVCIREYRDIINPSRFDVIKQDDVIFIASAVDVVTKVLKTVGSERTGLKLLDSSAMDLPGFGSELIEVVLSDQNPYIGRTLGNCCGEFSEQYKVAIISTRSRKVSQNEQDPHRDGAEDIETGSESGSVLPSTDYDTRTMILASGDMVLCLAKLSDIPALKNSSDFFVASTVGSVPPPMSAHGFVPVVIFLIMICVVAAGLIKMCPAALCTASLFLVGGWIKGSEIPKLVNMRLLLLMGCSVSFAASMETSGLASTLATGVIGLANPSPDGALYIVYVMTLLVTETMSNNAAAALMYPIGTAVARELNVSPIPFAMVVLIASTAAFMSPIGYQTHIMVWGPGGYKFMDFVRFGFIPDVIFWLTACTIAPALFPL